MEYSERLLIVTPIHREADYLDRVAAAIAAQHRRPDRWIVVDDGSTDGGREIADAWAQRLPFMTVISAPETPAAGNSDGLALARDARAFNHGLATAGWQEYTHIGKLDGDIELPPDWFESLLGELARHPRLGIVGGRLLEPTPSGWRMTPIPSMHVHGAVKLYTRECLEAIRGIPERLAWDTIDETYARMRGFATLSKLELVARHHRCWGSADGRLRGRARHGECSWVLHQPPHWALLRSLKLSRVAPVGLSGAAFAYGYLRAAARRTPRVEDPSFRGFMRRELRLRLHLPA